MKKITVILLVVLVVFGLTACNEHVATPTTPSTSTTPTEWVPPTHEEIEASKFLDEKMKLVFENDSITLKMTKIGMDQVSRKVYEFAEGGDKPDEQAVLTQLRLTFYDGNPKPKVEVDHNPEDVLVEIPERPIILTFQDINYNLHTADDICVTQVFESPAGELMYAFPGEILQELYNRDYGQYCVQVDARFSRINGDDTRICGFDFKGEVAFDEQFNIAALSKIPTTFTDAGATLTFKTSELLKSCGIDVTTVKRGDVFQFDFFDVHSSKQNNYLIDETDLTLTIEDGIPEELVVEMKYADAATKNHVIYQDVSKEGERGYVHTRAQWTNENGEQFAHAYLLLDITAAYTNPEPEQPSTPTEPPVSESITETLPDADNEAVENNEDAT